jgi:hypothetical protein
MNESLDYEEFHVKCISPNVVKKRKTKNEGYKHFYNAWAIHLPWAQNVVNESGKVHKVRCKLCTYVEGKHNFL